MPPRARQHEPPQAAPRGRSQLRQQAHRKPQSRPGGGIGGRAYSRARKPTQGHRAARGGRLPGAAPMPPRLRQEAHARPQGRPGWWNRCKGVLLRQQAHRKPQSRPPFLKSARVYKRLPPPFPYGKGRSCRRPGDRRGRLQSRHGWRGHDTT